jgi:hypothetical protein
MSGKLPPGAPASANDFWTTFKGVVSDIWGVVKYAAPYLMPLLLA